MVLVEDVLVFDAEEEEVSTPWENEKKNMI